MNRIRLVLSYVFFLMIFLNIFNISVFVCSEESDRIITITADENKLRTHISLSGFTEGCFPGDYPKAVSDWADEIDLFLELNFDQETVTGTISGSGSDTKYSYSYEYHWDFIGTITGSISQVSRGQTFYWKLEGTADITLNVNAQWECYNSQTEERYTKEAGQVLHITANVTADSDVKHESLNHFNFQWTDYNGIDQGTRSFRVSCGNINGYSDCELTDEIPEPINLSVSLNGPDIIDKGSNSAIFKLNPKGRDQDMVNQVWWSFYYKNPNWDPETDYLFEWEWIENYVKDDLTDLVVPKNNISRWLDLVDQIGISVNGVKQLELRVDVEIEDKNRITLVKNDPNTYSLPNWTFVCSTSKTNRYQLIGLSQEYPMKYMDISLSDANDEVDFETSTDDQGYFTLPEMDSGVTYDLQIYFSYKIGDITYFSMYGASDLNPVVLHIKLLNDKMQTMTLYAMKKITIPVSGALPSTIQLTDYLTSESGLISFVSIYNHFTEVLEFYKDYLHEEINFQLPVYIYTFTNRFENPTAYVWGKGWLGDDKSGIFIDSRKSNHDSEWRPIVEYHEFSHYIMHNLYKKMPQSPPSNIKDVNHGGYLNPTTADSYSEGFAEFMSVIIANHYERWWIQDVSKKSYSSLCTGHGSLEINNVVWGNIGRDEEWAVAGVLWDLYDGNDEGQVEKTRLREKWTSEYNYIVAEFDLNSDGKLGKNEFITRMLIRHYDWSSEEFISKTSLIQFMGELVTPFKDSDEEVLSSEVLSKYETSNPILVHDKDGDKKFNDTEFISFLESIDIDESYGKNDYGDAYVKGYDLDGDGYLSDKELTRIAAGEEILKEALNEYDSDKDGILSKNELYKWTLEEGETLVNVCFKRSGTVASDLESYILKNKIPEIITLEYILENIKGADDDTVDLSFEEIWSILRLVHDDFTSVYNAFIEKFPNLKKDIDEIFKNHGFFIDIDKGNGLFDLTEPFRDVNDNVIYDAGDVFVDYPINGFQYNSSEIIGSAANYNRLERRSSEPLPGHFIKIDNNVPFYHVEVELYDDSFLYYAFPSYYYDYEVLNENGSIYISIPPAKYGALITVTGIGVQTGTPLVISGEDFYDHYVEAVDQGYFTSHDFEITGDIPGYPVDPFEVSTIISGSDSQTPGFEMILIILGILILLYNKKKQVC